MITKVGSSNFVGFSLAWECQDTVYDECASGDHDCHAYQTCLDKVDGYSCLTPQGLIISKLSSLTGRFPKVSYALVPACAKLTHFGLREEIAQD